jgi:hypothetical protein
MNSLCIPRTHDGQTDAVLLVEEPANHLVGARIAAAALGSTPGRKRRQFTLARQGLTLSTLRDGDKRLRRVPHEVILALG